MVLRLCCCTVAGDMSTHPFDRQVAALAATHRLVAPDRTGYGRSNGLRDLPTDFHQRAAEETIRVLDALGLARPIVWGHSDGAVIALRLGLTAPSRVAGIIAEATHFFRDKPASRAFFETMRDAPDLLGDRVTAVLRARSRRRLAALDSPERRRMARHRKGTWRLIRWPAQRASCADVRRSR